MTRSILPPPPRTEEQMLGDRLGVELYATARELSDVFERLPEGGLERRLLLLAESCTREAAGRLRGDDYGIRYWGQSRRITAELVALSTDDNALSGDLRRLILDAVQTLNLLGLRMAEVEPSTAGALMALSPGERDQLGSLARRLQEVLDRKPSDSAPTPPTEAPPMPSP